MASVAEQRRTARARRHARVRRKVVGQPDRPRLCVFRSHKHIYAQVIDDRAGGTVVAASTVDADFAARGKGKTKRQQAALVGELVAERAKSKGIIAVVFDRGGYNYHGRVRELADAARKSGLQF